MRVYALVAAVWGVGAQQYADIPHPNPSPKGKGYEFDLAQKLLFELLGHFFDILWRPTGNVHAKA